VGVRAARRVALMSIHPEYAEAILRGSKKIEFRKRALAADIDTVVIYATAPVQRIVGEFILKETISTTPSRLWDMFKAVGGIRRHDYRRYYAGTRLAVGLSIHSASAYANHVALADLPWSQVPPQSFCYLDGGALRDIRLLAGVDPGPPGWRDETCQAIDMQTEIPYDELLPARTHVCSNFVSPTR
jgi:predicted transcriptional regulator